MICLQRPNNSFKPNLLRYTNNMAGRACHVVASATQVGLTQALGSAMNSSVTEDLENVLNMLRPFDERRERARSEEHTSELQSLMRISYAVFCLKKKKKKTQ